MKMIEEINVMVFIVQKSQFCLCYILLLDSVSGHFVRHPTLSCISVKDKKHLVMSHYLTEENHMKIPASIKDIQVNYDSGSNFSLFECMKYFACHGPLQWFPIQKCCSLTPETKN